MAGSPGLTFNTLAREACAKTIPKNSECPALHELMRPHIDSFNSIFDDHLIEAALQKLEVKEAVDQAGNKLRFWIEEVSVGKPMLHEKESFSLNRALYPSECRQRGITYKAKISCSLLWSLNGSSPVKESRVLGSMPIMVKSNRCHLNGMSPRQLVEAKEDSEELGGYFIINGIEKLVRLLIVPRRNHVFALVRSSFAKRGPLYSTFGTSIRCVRPDQTAQTITLHYCNDGNITVRFSFRKNEYLVPFVLIAKALIHTNDKEIFDSIVQENKSDTFITGRVEVMLREFKKYGLLTQSQCLAYLGSRFHVVLGLPSGLSEEQIGAELLNMIVLVHLDSNLDKFNLLVFMVRKLYGLVSGKYAADNPDSPMHQEILLDGHLYVGFLKEKLDDWLNTLKAQILTDLKKAPALVDFAGGYFKKCLGKVNSDIGKKLEYFLATGNLNTYSGMDLQQVTGYTVVAEKLNFLRYLSHFRSVHRGAFFAELKTTTVRKLLPEAWGFLCPVHTPDGAPCGLLNHLSHKCSIISATDADNSDLLKAVVSLGMTPLSRGYQNDKFVLPVMLNGLWIGLLEISHAANFVKQLRLMKVVSSAANEETRLFNYKIPSFLEIGYIPESNGGLYPGIYLFTSPSRMMRPVKYLATGHTEYIGTLEQVYMDIACTPADIYPNISTHIEIDPTNILSVIANITPFSDFNQSPRNMYQCQMGKQSMGTPTHSFPYRTDNKLYRLQHGQTPIVRPRLYNDYGFDLYPNGANAIVAVISYTGYDMEDAMIINKSSLERGFGHGCIYKSKYIDLSDLRVKGQGIGHRFSSRSGKFSQTIDLDGLPHVGQLIQPGDPLYSIEDEITGLIKTERYEDFESAYVEEVRLLGNDTGDEELQKIQITFRLNRRPDIGDKFSSRHGQKGVLSQRFPMVDMPFSESGMVPDVIINTHAFPSRMTIGMFVESMAGKSGALHGLCQDATPFKFSEEFTACEYFGEQLRLAGYNYYGNEPMYSGSMGVELRADIYLGVVYYQRLRHMVSDKFQVRTTGPVHNLTQQPLKGRKRAGGIRFGEMERDSLLAHGVSYMLQDRLMNCSDYSQAYVCTKCGSVLSPTSKQSLLNPSKKIVECRSCLSDKHIDVIAIPYVFRYLSTELMAMNIRLMLHVK